LSCCHVVMLSCCHVVMLSCCHVVMLSCCPCVCCPCVCCPCVLVSVVCCHVVMLSCCHVVCCLLVSVMAMAATAAPSSWSPVSVCGGNPNEPGRSSSKKPFWSVTVTAVQFVLLLLWDSRLHTHCFATCSHADMTGPVPAVGVRHGMDVARDLRRAVDSAKARPTEAVLTGSQQRGDHEGVRCSDVEHAPAVAWQRVP
jgi:hypothetical protein